MAKNSKDAVPNKSLFLLTSFLGSEKLHETFKVTKLIKGKSKIVDEQINPYDIAILLVIARYSDMKHGFCFLKQSALAKQCCMSPRFLRERLSVLIQGNFVVCIPKGKLNRYQFYTALTGEENDYLFTDESNDVGTIRLCVAN